MRTCDSPVFASLLAGLLMLAATPALTARSAPSWVQGAGADAASYPPSRFLTGYGLSSPKGTGAEQRKEAIAMAREALASAIRVHVSSQFTSRVTQANQTMTHHAQNLVQTRADLDLAGLDTMLTWEDEASHVVHALAVLDKPKTLRLLQGQLEREAQECNHAFQSGRASGGVADLLRARNLRERVEESFLVASVLSDSATDFPPCPTQATIKGELRKVYADTRTLDGCLALAGLDLGDGLPQGTKVLMDRVTFADTPFCGSFSTYVERALAGHLVAIGQVKILDKAAGRAALQGSSLEGSLAEALRAQAIVSGTCFELKDGVKLDLKVVALTGEHLAASSTTIPVDLVRKAGLKLAPDNLQEAQHALAIQNARVQASKLQVKLALDRGDGGIYRQGDKLYLFLKANMDCFVKIIYQQVDGTQVLIFPNKHHPDARITRDRVYQVPPDDNSFDLAVGPPFGAELVKVIASTEPIYVPTKAQGPNGLSEVNEDLASLLGRTRGITLQKKDAQYAEDTAVVNTMSAEVGARAL